jgi:hypothetical protein
VTIVNATPTAPVVEIIPESPRLGDMLTALLRESSTDADGDAIRYKIRWLRSQDGGETFQLNPILTEPWVYPPYIAEGDVWRAEFIPFEVETGIEGETGWDQVYIGDDSRPTVRILSPGTDIPALGPVTIQWEAEDADGDPVTVDLYYDTDRTEGGAVPISGGLPATGAISWTPPGLPDGILDPDYNGDGLVAAEDLFHLASKWQQETGEKRFVIFARAWARGTVGEDFSDGDIIVPSEFPTDMNGLLELLGQWHAE